MREAFDVIIVGGGIVGTLALRELSKYMLSVLLLEAGSDLASGATRANSAIVHAGYDPVPGTNKAIYNVKGAAMYEQLCKELDVVYKPLPSLVVAYEEEEEQTLHELYLRGLENGVRELSLISKDMLLEMEPNVADSARGALLARGSAIIEPWMAAIAAAENACDNGAEVLFNHKVVDMKRNGDLFWVLADNIGESREFHARAVINAAGVNADDIHNMVAEPSYKITGRRGQYYVLDKAAGGIVNNILFPCPSPKSKGMLILPEIHGRILVGPDSEICSDKSDTRTTRTGLDIVRETVGTNLKVKIPYDLTIRTFSGVRPTPDTGDFIIGACSEVPGFIEAGGIESPGLASAPAIAERLRELVLEFFGERKEKTTFQNMRKPSFDTAQAARSGVFGASHIVCRCEGVSEAEIVDCIHRNCGARTVKGVKLRTGAGVGGCQGGFCQPEVVRILARELKKDASEILYDGPGSNILIGRTRP